MIHPHEENLVEEIQEGEFSFHPFLATWFRKAFGLNSKQILVVYEISCDTKDCPIEETLIKVKDENVFLKIGRYRKNISKMDFHLAIQKQKPISL
jgi:hypothetical protein